MLEFRVGKEKRTSLLKVSGENGNLEYIARFPCEQKVNRKLREMIVDMGNFAALGLLKSGLF